MGRGSGAKSSVALPGCRAGASKVGGVSGRGVKGLGRVGGGEHREAPVSRLLGGLYGFCAVTLG